MAKKNNANKYWIYGEDAALAAQFTAYLAKVLKKPCPQCGRFGRCSVILCRGKSSGGRQSDDQRENGP